jgi:hypothetical protein
VHKQRDQVHRQRLSDMHGAGIGSLGGGGSGEQRTHMGQVLRVWGVVSEHVGDGSVPGEPVKH